MSHPTVICIPHSTVICILRSQCQLLLPPNSVIYILHPTVSLASPIQRCHLHPSPKQCYFHPSPYSVICHPNPTMSFASLTNVISIPHPSLNCIPHPTVLFVSTTQLCHLQLSPNRVNWIPYLDVLFASLTQQSQLHPLPSRVICIPHPTVSTVFHTQHTKNGLWIIKKVSIMCANASNPLFLKTNDTTNSFSMETSSYIFVSFS